MRIVEIGNKDGSLKYSLVIPDEVIPEVDPFLYMGSYNMLRIAYNMRMMDNYRHNADYYMSIAKQRAIAIVSSYIGRPLPEPLKNILFTKGKKAQERLLKNFSFSIAEFATFMLFAGKNGYSFSQYFYESEIPENLKGRIPIIIDATNDPIKTLGKTNLSDDALKHIVREKKRIIAQFLTKNENWVCFYRTSKGLSGEEPGKQGSQSHMHFISSEYNLSKESLIAGFKDGKTPSNGYHIKLSNYLNWGIQGI